MATMTFAIRRADPADFETVAELTVRAYVADGHLAADAAYAAVLADTASRAAAAEVWVAVDDDPQPVGRNRPTVLGSVTFAAPGSALAQVSGPGEGEFRMLAVAAEARRLGVGEALVRHCIDRARALGLTGLAISTQPSMGSAHRIYERLGFERTPERDWDPVPGIRLLTYRLHL
jgi:ribosomal protein S18 acetylase RimI-like enzyme